jgi:hypothetical protein
MNGQEKVGHINAHNVVVAFDTIFKLLEANHHAKRQPDFDA